MLSKLVFCNVRHYAALILFLATAVSVYAQNNVSLRGRVTDNTGSPLAGASVGVVGAAISTVTDADGNYLLDVPSDARIVVSYVGYDPIEESVDARDQIDVVLYDSLSELEFLLDIGYGSQKKGNLTIAVSSLDATTTFVTPSPNPMEALQGRVAGLDVVRERGLAGSDVKMQLRGNRSFTASGTPAVIIDGMPGDYSTLNPNDIESVEVLKDASSTAIYGSNGSNGVILITTKSGHDGNTVVNFNMYAGINGWSRVPEMRSGESYMAAIRDAMKAAGKWTAEGDHDSNAFNAALNGDEAYEMHKAGKYISWRDELLSNGSIQNYSLSVAGGSERTKSYFSLNYSLERGEYSHDDNRIYSSSIRVDHRARHWLSLGVNGRISYVYRNRAQGGLEDALILEPLGSLYNEDGKLNVTTFGSNYNYLLNNHDNYRDNTQHTRLYFHPYVEVRPLDGLSLLSRVQANIDIKKSNSFYGIGSFNYYSKTGFPTLAMIQNDRNLNYKWENVLTYHHIFAAYNDVTLTLVSSWEHNQSDESLQKQDGIKDNSYLWHNMSGDGDLMSSYSMTKSLGFVGRLSYAYADRYLATFSVRRDGDSRLSKDYRWDNFVAFSLGWRISDEQFMEATRDWLRTAKIRLGYGVTGTASIAPYSSVSNLESTSISFSGVSTDVWRYSKNYANPNLKWEKSHNLNVGLDASLFGGRLDVVADLYKTTTDGIIWSHSLPVTDGGYSSSVSYVMAQNVAQTENKGIELQLNSTNVEIGNFSWASSVALTLSKEKITRLTDGSADNVANGSNFTLTVGEAVNSYYHYKIDGIWQKGEEADAAVFGKAPGDIKIATSLTHLSAGQYSGIDDEGNEVIYNADNQYNYSEADYRTLGHNSPDMTLGFQNTLRWKGLDFGALLFWRHGQMIKYDMLSSFDPRGVKNFPVYFNYWTDENASNDFPAVNADRSITSYTGYAALSYVDGSYFKVKNVTLGYTFPSALMEKMGVSRFRIYSTLNNPIVHAKSRLLKDYDPEQNGQFNSPLTRQLVFGINLTF